MAIKRLHYYDHQFLVEADFTDEQAYHLGMRRRLTKLLHTFGIGDGLAVLKTGSRQVTVKPGVAMDRDGREMVLETDKVLDLSNAATFPPGSAVHVTIAYGEAETDPSTATGAPGNTRMTEAPLVTALTTAPPTDGTVVRLAQFTLTGPPGPGEVPGPLNAELDGGVRQSAGAKLAPDSVAESNLVPALRTKINTPQGLVSLDGVSNPGGNIDLVKAQAITITSDDAGNKITIGESHSALTNNPHNVTAAQIGALLASQYELGKRALRTIQFTQLDTSPATKPVPVPFQPRLVLALSTCFARLGGAAPAGRLYGGATTGVFDVVSGQRCTGFGMNRINNNDWFTRGDSLVPTAGICGALFIDAAPVQGESLLVEVAATATGLDAKLTRTTVAGSPLTEFQLVINMLCMGP